MKNKTIQNDYFDRYPKTKKDRSGSPVACADRSGYTVSFGYCLQTKCYDCWQRPMMKRGKEII